ncbi:hypothetical protein [Methanoplanus limicola]|uniref:Uncharacterized protein n=1 Tax=Methanoplanus limicola DSM 2279 TaxID=937775 RepID=H1Z192_9EURY|nr:hypothetical protein [Methanoplanus limicola]EHQ35359.1 hypothetical protein Metlim_1250 [Methanoplanus limicola DSM 2279]
MTEIIPVTCPFCYDGGLENLENLIVIVQGWPVMGWRCSCCRKSFSILHPHVQAVIRKTLNEEFRKRRVRKNRKVSYHILKGEGNVGLGVMA